jgi:hypothetical protein
MGRTLIGEGAGWFALIIDTEGNRLALHERTPAQKSAPAAKPAAPKARAKGKAAPKKAAKGRAR